MPPRSTSDRFALALGTIALVGVLLRLAYIALTPGLTPGPDWQFFAIAAAEIEGGRGYRVPRQTLDPSDRAPRPPRLTAAHPPAYPVVLALWRSAGARSEGAQRALGALLGGVSIVAMALVARRVAGTRAGLIAALLAATSPVLIGVDGALMSETLFVALVSVLLWLALDVASRPKPGPVSAAMLGLMIALATLCRSEGLTLLPLLGFALAFPRAVASADSEPGSSIGPGGTSRRASRVRHLALMAVVCGVVVGAWTLRNWAVFGVPILVSSNACGVLGGANCATAYSGHDLGGWDLACLAPPSGNEAQDAARWCADGVAFAFTHLERWPAVAAARLLRTWNLWPSTFWTIGEGRLRSVEWAGKAWSILVLVIALSGAYGLWRREREVACVLAAPIAMAALAGALGWGLPRLQAGALPSLAALAAIRLAPRAAARERR